MPRFVLYDKTTKEVLGRVRIADARFDDPDRDAKDVAAMTAYETATIGVLPEDITAEASKPSYIDDSDPAKPVHRPRPEGQRPALDKPSYRVGEAVTVSNIAPGSELFIDGVSQGVIDTGSFQFQTSGRGYHYLVIKRFPDMDHEITVKHDRRPNG